MLFCHYKATCLYQGLQNMGEETEIDKITHLRVSTYGLLGNRYAKLTPPPKSPFNVLGNCSGAMFRTYSDVLLRVQLTIFIL